MGFGPAVRAGCSVAAADGDRTWLSRGADGASATELQPPPHLLTTLPAPAGGGRCGSPGRGLAGVAPKAAKARTRPVPLIRCSRKYLFASDLAIRCFTAQTPKSARMWDEMARRQKPHETGYRTRTLPFHPPIRQLARDHIISPVLHELDAYVEERILSKVGADEGTSAMSKGGPHAPRLERPQPRYASQQNWPGTRARRLFAHHYRDSSNLRIQ